MSHYTVSSSESGSFCTNTAPHSHMRAGTEHSESAVASFSKRTHMHPSVVAAADGGFDEEAADSAYSENTPKKPLQSTKTSAATMAQESPSMTIRRVPLDYSKRMEDQKARSSALERYKMLFRGNRQVESKQPSPNSVDAEEVGELSKRRDDEQSEAFASPAGCSAMDETVVSDDSETEEGKPAVPVSKSLRSAGERVSSASSQRMPQRTRSSSSPVPVSVSMNRPIARPAEPAAGNPEGGLTGDSPAPAVLQLSLSKTHGPPSQPAAACATGDDGNGGVPYVAPELTQPYCKPNQRRRDTLRPGFEPVTAHDCTSLHRTLSASFAQADVSPSTSSSQLQPRSYPHKDSGTKPRLASTSAAAAPPSPRSTSRRKRDAVKATPAMAATTSVFPQQDTSETAAEEAGATAATDLASTSLASRGVATQLFHDDEKGNLLRQADVEEDGVESLGAPDVNGTPKQEQEVILLASNNKAFWLRPSTAMYEMTASIAAKRKDHHEDEEEMRRSPNRRHQNQSRSCAATASTASSCGTPRGRPSTSAEAKPRFTTHMTAAHRERCEEVPAAVASAPAHTYGSIYSARQAAAHKRALSRPIQRMTTDASTVNRACDSPRRASQHQPQRRAAPRACSLRSPLERRSSTLSHLSSDPPMTASSEERHRAVNSGRVSTRQQDSFSKHCARVAARNSRPEESAGAAAEPAKRSRTKAVAASACETPVKGEVAVPSKPMVHKKLQFETEAESEPRKNVPKATDRVLASPVEPKPVPPSPETTMHGLHRPGEGSPSKSRRREHDLTASPARPDDHTDAESGLDAQDAAMEREKEEARVQQVRTALESFRKSRQACMNDPKASHVKATSTSTNEVVAAMLQGIVQQTRQTLPCYLCADQQNASAYHVHVDLCRPKTEALLCEYYTAMDDVKDILAALQERIQHVAAQEVPSSTSPETERDAFAKKCYQCVKAMLVACRKCGVQVRVHDVKEHEMLCGRACYRSSRAAERVRATVERIDHGSQE
ncbi:conserved hypothetical protein [Leishmania infantum JPCM5]|uniref:Uncharacterized protein n=2 Tax=Leishmania infantum TaxID=5671 RepID=A4I882_LEIIN|nr:conserved hypothetical protein [Leishmania infantum JPCM5]CAC9526650.1 hypothetical_protein_-_conserved [Leishmania infantum]CAM71023.1 conserved hypothetical protein [Leishmania infantum JPCM5]SUZ44845.1 hypothetical_protein_-_conserved [Leishmania infantum]|eukprot:XP_001467951.1 conserved hypothetical protein [Leishmania infantum JPCM5]